MSVHAEKKLKISGLPLGGRHVKEKKVDNELSACVRMSTKCIKERLMTFEQLKQALQIFDLPSHATLKEIKTRHRILVKRFHPDSGEQQDTERIRLINAAYKVLLEYCTSYKFSFSLEEFYEQNPEERLRKQFSQDPLWGNGSESSSG
jgi:hypothetical protein